MSLPPPFKKLVDLSLPIKSQATAVYPGYPMPIRATMTTIRENGYFSNLWTFVEHSGTHVDAPAHFAEGAPPIERVPLTTYIGRGAILEFAGKKSRYSITKNDVIEGLKKKGLQGRVGPGWVLLFYTGYSSKAGTPEWLDHPELSQEACDLITELRINAIGFDAPGPDHEPFPAHKTLLPKGIAIFESLTNLDKLLDKDFVFFGAPLPLVDGSASPVRAFALVQ